VAWLIGIGALLLVAGFGFTIWLFLLGPWRTVDLSAQAPAPQPPLSVSAEEWRKQKSTLREMFERDVYGAMPAAISPTIVNKVAIASAHAGGIERVEQWRIELGPAGHFHMAIARPPGEAPAPTVLILNFAGNRAAFPNRPRAIAGPARYVQWFCRYGALDPILERVFGRYINGPPFTRLTERGYAVALIYAGDVVPDRQAEARVALSQFAPADTGAVMAWAWVASRAWDALAGDKRFDANRIALWGQSRQGKAALVAGAFDERFAAIIALQAGRGGDAPNFALAGESLPHMTRFYPHWFAPSFASRTPSVDQHQLLALIAPRPLLVGHAKRDRWSDPVGAHAARDAAAPVFRALGAEAPSSFIRSGAHGITLRDWEETLNFLDASMAP
jgi:hypothetical protein